MIKAKLSPESPESSPSISSDTSNEIKIEKPLKLKKKKGNINNLKAVCVQQSYISNARVNQDFFKLMTDPLFFLSMKKKRLSFQNNENQAHIDRKENIENSCQNNSFTRLPVISKSKVPNQKKNPANIDVLKEGQQVINSNQTKKVDVKILTSDNFRKTVNNKRNSKIINEFYENIHGYKTLIGNIRLRNNNQLDNIVDIPEILSRTKKNGLLIKKENFNNKIRIKSLKSSRNQKIESKIYSLGSSKLPEVFNDQKHPNIHLITKKLIPIKNRMR